MDRNRYTGHLANSGGLQGHSIGESYPWAVIGVQSGPDAPTRYKVQNLCTGEQFVHLFKGIERAHEAALSLKNDPDGVDELRATNFVIFSN